MQLVRIILVSASLKLQFIALVFLVKVITVVMESVSTQSGAEVTEPKILILSVNRKYLHCLTQLKNVINNEGPRTDT
jgi:uncharacterized membrane protein